MKKGLSTPSYVRAIAEAFTIAAILALPVILWVSDWSN